MRVYCPRCLKAETTCYCAQLKPAAVRTRIVLLQHPREYRNPIGTARMTQLSLENSKLIVGLDFDNDPQVQTLLRDERNQCVVLFPGPAAQNLSRLDKAELKLKYLNERCLVLFVLDGTWHCAKKIITVNPVLAALPQVSFEPGKKSEYGGVRRQPREYCVSTYEAVHRVLAILEPAVDLEPMLQVFRKMVGFQAECMRS
ncbi:MAG TPA: DTW domain-containing protein [Bdellovibrionales bacterium]|nr:DTW domain-containing protein [Bdellovibrionales bacterium]